MKQTERKTKKQKEVTTAGALCNDKNCNMHGSLKTRGRIFEGKVVKKFTKRIVIEFERMVYVKKYERYKKSKTKLHARLPDCVQTQVKIGDYVKIQECKPLSKIVHFVFIKKIKDEAENPKEVKK